MRFKTIFPFFLLTAALALFPQDESHAGTLIDKVAAAVNNGIITYTDVEKAILFYPELLRLEKTDEDFYRHIVDELVNYRVVFLEYRDEFTLSEDDYEQVQTPILQKIGSMDQLRDILQGYQMTWSDFQAFIREKVLFEKVMRERFSMNIEIAFADIEAFYQTQYIPSQSELQIEPRSMVEMAPTIEKYLRQARTAERLSAWLNDLKRGYRIDIKLKV